MRTWSSSVQLSSGTNTMDTASPFTNPDSQFCGDGAYLRTVNCFSQVISPTNPSTY